MIGYCQWCFSLAMLNYQSSSIYIYTHEGRIIPSDGVFTRRHTAECAFCTVFYSVFCFSTMLPWEGGGGGGQEQLFLRVMFSAFVHLHWFLQCFSPLSHFFFHHLRFPLVFTVFSGFMTLLMLRCTLGWGGVGWGGAITFMWTWQITLLRLHHVADATGGMLTFHVTCSRCWCYATLGWGGC